jgi:nanoRNase/pAp phosphatase (c-di-AMP/oligoRNAs hydrolase)
MGFYFDGQKYNVSLYHSPHNKQHDLSLIAVKYGGGGHKGACGFQADKLPFLP